ncbi:sialate O-acetylesterase [Novosphingobium cyanobacteriorum]|uniref:Sialate O-acetylesterase n=1 Tax=Novosphingobium cyanobacteriorum TaxID=3024215 RepID=A0ABT6CFR1_9SPHN|nr:sialate O-acetylesterase [Novosphingobium cyanobacteriorum]MDF8332758.1 sialate O-acetylesterase [Novosphingobium cyanobacteriorum]
MKALPLAVLTLAAGLSAPALAALALATPALAAPAQVGPVLELEAAWGDHAVIQRDRPIVVEGTAAPGAVVEGTLDDERVIGEADRKGRFSLQFKARPASATGVTLTVRADGEAVRAADLLVGDVWLCSGQSNMEFPLSRALNGGMEAAFSTDPALRLLQAPKALGYLPDRHFAKPTAWAAAAPASAQDFSAVCYFMARELRRARGVPVGAIHASWGGSKVTPWLDPQAGAAISGPGEMALLALFARDRMAAVTQFAPRWQDWYAQGTGGTKPWAAPDALEWQAVPAMSGWRAWTGTPLAAKATGTVWLRRQVTLSAAQARAGATLALGVLDDMDMTFVNGRAVGNTFGWDEERAYRLPPAFLKAGVNEILVAVTNTFDNGGFASPADKLALTVDGGERIALGDGWRYAIAPLSSYPPRPPWDANAGIGLMHNRMIAPLGRFAMEGVAWYQGESDVDTPDYERRMQAMIAGWRARFGQGLKVGIVQLANYGQPASAPTRSDWAHMRDEQRRIAAGDPAGFLASAIDLGERTDIHPANKLLVGQRLALGAQGKAMPMPVAAVREGDAVRVRFKGVEGGLHAWSAAAPIGFELCDAADACRFAAANVDGDTVVLASDGQAVVKVRYAWADSPVVNLFDARALPVPGFELAVTEN